MWFFLSMYIFSILGFLVHYYSLPSYQRTRFRLIELLLLYQMVFSLGSTSFLSFFGLTLMDVYIANYLNWPASPFEQELGNVNLAFGVLGVMAIWYRREFWLAIPHPLSSITTFMVSFKSAVLTLRRGL